MYVFLFFKNDAKCPLILREREGERDNNNNK